MLAAAAISEQRWKPPGMTHRRGVDVQADHDEHATEDRKHFPGSPAFGVAGLCLNPQVVSAFGQTGLSMSTQPTGSCQWDSLSVV